MSLSDTAEYWQDIKRNYPYIGPNYYHIKGYNCGHRHLYESEYISEINCRSCIRVINEYPKLKKGLSPSQKRHQKKINKIKRNNEIYQQKQIQKYGQCSCGYAKTQRTNKISGEHFLGCSNYPKCKITSKL